MKVLVVAAFLMVGCVWVTAWLRQGIPSVTECVGVCPECGWMTDQAEPDMVEVDLLIHRALLHDHDADAP